MPTVLSSKIFDVGSKPEKSCISIGTLSKSALPTTAAGQTPQKKVVPILHLESLSMGRKRPKIIDEILNEDDKLETIEI